MSRTYRELTHTGIVRAIRYKPHNRDHEAWVDQLREYGMSPRPRDIKLANPYTRHVNQDRNISGHEQAAFAWRKVYQVPGDDRPYQRRETFCRIYTQKILRIRERDEQTKR